MKSLIVMFFLFFAVAANAQSTLDAVSSAQGKLDYTLNTLKDSVARLSDENKKLAAGNDQIKLKLNAANDALKLEQVRGDKLDAQVQAQEPKFQKKMAERAAVDGQWQQGVVGLEGIAAQRASVEGQLKVLGSEDSALAAEAEALASELQDIRTGLVQGEDHTAELEALRVSQQGAQKDLDAYTAELDRIRGEWKELAVFINAGPGQVAVLTQEQTGLKDDIARRSKEIEALRQQLAAVVKESGEIVSKVSDEALLKVEQDVQSLEVQAKGLEKEIADAEKSTRSGKASTTQDAKLKKDEARFKDLLQRNRDLTMGLKNLQRSMVSMDKKKSALEKDLEQNRGY